MTDDAGPRWINTRSLNASDIVATARAIAIDEGFDALSMRAIARRLDVSPMAAYRHVGNKHSLLALLIDDTLAGVEVPQPGSGNWEDRLVELGRRSDLAMAACPGIEREIFSVRPTEQGWRLMDAYMQILLDAGFSERNAALAFGVLHSHAVGRAAIERALLSGPHPAITAPESAPAMRRVQGQWSQLHRADFRGFATQVIVTGLRQLRELAPDAPAETERR